MRRFFLLLGAFLPLLFLAGCETAPPGIQYAKVAMAQKYATETPGDYFIGRRYYKPDFKFWGYIRRTGQPWSESQLVMLNEKQKLAPDREQLDFGSDNNYDYKLYGQFSGDNVYEPASNTMYPELVLISAVLVTTGPGPVVFSHVSGRAQAEVGGFVVNAP